MLILSFPDPDASITALKHLRTRFEKLPILVRTRDDSRLEAFNDAGATEVIPEALEGSLMMISHILSLLKVPNHTINKQINHVRSEHYSMLHGYYHGTHSQKFDSTGKMKEILHPVPLDKESYACKRTLKELSLDESQVNVAMIRRHNKSEHNPEGKTVCKAGDILILRGPSDKIEIAEQILLLGK
jgi:CPA2 family monovalent cation:H+ antiporter-2